MKQVTKQSVMEVCKSGGCGKHCLLQDKNEGTVHKTRKREVSSEKDLVGCAARENPCYRRTLDALSLHRHKKFTSVCDGNLSYERHLIHLS